MAIKKKMQMGGKAKPMSGKVGAYAELEKKAAGGDRQGKLDLKLEKSNYKKFGDGPGSGPSGAMPKPKMKMGGKMKKAEKGGSFDLNKDGKTTFKDVLIGRGVLPKTAKSGTSMKKCKYGCK
jgi:hypothetical protein